MTTWIDTDPDGFPEGTYIVNRPPTCAAPADAYVAPPCSQWTQEIHFPDIWMLPNTGSEPLLELALVAASVILAVVMVWLVVKIKERRS